MNFKKAIPQPFAVLNTAPQKKWDNINQKDFDALMQTPYGIKYAHDFQEKTKKEMQTEVSEKLRKTLISACVQNFFRSVRGIEKTYAMMAMKKERKGWQKNHLSIKEVIAGMILCMGEENTEEIYADQECERIHDTYGQSFKFNDFDINKEFGLENVTPYEDESIFDDMTAWEIYELGLHHGDVTARLINTITLFHALREHKSMTPKTVNSIILKANDIAEQIAIGEVELTDLLTVCEKNNFRISKHFIDVANQYVKYNAMYDDRFRLMTGSDG